MTDAETIASLKAELAVRQSSYNDLLMRMFRMEEEIQRLDRMRGVLNTLCQLTREVYDQRKAEEDRNKT